jgi:hypothetical protein
MLSLLAVAPQLNEEHILKNIEIHNQSLFLHRDLVNIV